MTEPMSDAPLELDAVKRGARALRRQAKKADNIVPFAGDAIVEMALVYEGYLELHAEVERLKEELGRAVAEGKLRPCGIPACNCGGYHSLYASRMSEFADKLKSHEEAMREAIAAMCTTRLDGEYDCRIPGASVAVDILLARLEEKS